MLISLKNKRELPPLDLLHFIALREIFEPSALVMADHVMLEEGITNWSKKADLTQEERLQLKRLVNGLIANENGYFDRAKQLLRDHHGDYKKMYADGIPYIEVEGRKWWNKS